MNLQRTQAAYTEATRLIYGGVNGSSVAFASPEAFPILAQSGRGSRIRDIDNNEYIDYICSSGSLILGHGPELLLRDAQQIIDEGVAFGVATVNELELVKRITKMYCSAEMVKIVNSDTEAVINAVRLARAYTGRNKVLRFDGCRHGSCDALTAAVGSGRRVRGRKNIIGIPNGTLEDILVCAFNDCASVSEVFSKYGDQIACVIVEPIAMHMGLVRGTSEFIETLRRLCSCANALLIFDETTSGFRVAPGGAAQLYDVEPDMVCLGGVIGGGFPIGAYGGNKRVMQGDELPNLVGSCAAIPRNELAMAFGNRVLGFLEANPAIYEQLDRMAESLEKGLRANIEERGISARVDRCGSILSLMFIKGEANKNDDASRRNETVYTKYFKQMAKDGVLLPSSQNECMYLSLTHRKEDIRLTLEANKKALRAI